jgi:hypothetical protein
MEREGKATEYEIQENLDAVKQAIDAYHEIIASPEFLEIERIRSIARYEEEVALRQARMEGEVEGRAEEREIWQNVVANKDAEIACLRAQLDK